MIVIAGCLIVKDNKILMVKEAKKQCYGQWSFPAGHVEEMEKITDAAVREVYEETGCRVELKGVLPICTVSCGEGTLLMVRFVADVLEANTEFKNKDTNEILDVKWIDINEVKNMTRQELRGYDASIQFVKDFENNKIYPLDIFNNTKYVE